MAIPIKFDWARFKFLARKLGRCQPQLERQTTRRADEDAEEDGEDDAEEDAEEDEDEAEGGVDGDEDRTERCSEPITTDTAIRQFFCDGDGRPIGDPARRQLKLWSRLPKKKSPI